MAVFGLPQAHEDDALRAVRAGVVIRDRTARLGEEIGLPVQLQVRVGVNSGAVATGSGPADQLLVSGATVNMAARLQEAARPGEILVGETTWQLTRNMVRFGRARKVTAAIVETHQALGAVRPPGAALPRALRSIDSFGCGSCLPARTCPSRKNRKPH